MRSWIFLLVALAVGAAAFFGARYLHNDYVFFAGYVVLEYLVLATAWNILGGYCGYVNFGTAAFFALGAYTSVAVHKFSPMPIPVTRPAPARAGGCPPLARYRRPERSSRREI